MSSTQQWNRTWLFVPAVAVISFFVGLIIAANLDFTSVTPAVESSRRDTEALPPLAAILTEEGESPFVAVAQRVMPAVVNISAEHIVRSSGQESPFNFQFRGPFQDLFRDFFRNNPPFEGKYQSLGSGVIIDRAGYILTNNHVVEDADRIVVRLSDKTEYKGSKVQIVGTDPRTDLAVIKIEPEHELAVARLGDSDAVRVGDWAIAIGNPFGLDRTVTVGVISAKGRSGIPLSGGATQQDFMQTDASINPGNSGGPLINIQGEVIGINSAITTPTGFNVGIGFAIPINMARSIYPQLIESGRVVRGYLGVYLQELTPDLAEAMGVSEGVLVKNVVPETPAERAGMEAGDIIVEYGGTPVSSMAQIQSLVAGTEVGSRVEIRVVRDERPRTLRVLIGEMPEEVAGVALEQPGENEGEWLGMRVAAPGSEAARRFAVEAEKGVLVVAVELGSPADVGGMRGGDIIRRIGKVEIEDLKDYERARDQYRRLGKPIVFLVQRGEETSFVAVRPEE
jgi:serine protease Do